MIVRMKEKIYSICFLIVRFSEAKGAEKPQQRVAVRVRRGRGEQYAPVQAFMQFATTHWSGLAPSRHLPYAFSAAHNTNSSHGLSRLAPLWFNTLPASQRP